MDVRIPAAPTFTALTEPDPSPDRVAALEKRIKDLEATVVQVKALEATILAEKTVSLLKVGPSDTIVFTVSEEVFRRNEDFLHSFTQSLKEKMGVRHVLFASDEVNISVVSPQEG